MDPVIANKAIKVAITPEIGIVSPISKPKTRIAPINPNAIPKLQFTIVIKPNRQGSTFGLTIVKHKKQLSLAIKKGIKI